MTEPETNTEGGIGADRSTEAAANAGTNTTETETGSRAGGGSATTARSERDPGADFASSVAAFFNRRTTDAPQSVLALSIVGALISGYFLQWSVEGALLSVLAFGVFAFVSWVAIVRQPSARRAGATVCYTMAVAGVVAPVLFFAELAGRANSATGLEALGSGIGIVALFPTVSLLHIHVALAFALAGYAISRTARTPAPTEGLR